MTAVALRRLPVPDVVPGLEDLPAGLGATTPAGSTDRSPGRQVALRLVLPTGDELDVEDDGFGPVPTGRRDLPDPLPWSRDLVQVLAEVLGGHRACSQLLRWTTTEVFDVVRRVAEPVRRASTGPRQRAVVLSVRVCEPADGVAEVTAVMAVARRARAVALRLEGHDGRWRVTALQTA